jgi:hypothetical protein
VTQAGGMPAPTTASTPNGVTPKWRSLVCALRWSQTVIPPCGSRDSPNAVAVNKRYDFTRMEREFITTDISLRGLCRKHGISAHSLVTVQAKKGKWAEKREQYQAKESDASMSRHAARQADRVTEVRDKALDAIEVALDKFSSDMAATEKRRIDGEWVDVPVMRLKPGMSPSCSTASRCCSTGPPSSASTRVSPSAPSSPSMPCASSSRPPRGWKDHPRWRCHPCREDGWTTDGVALTHRS